MAIESEDTRLTFIVVGGGKTQESCQSSNLFTPDDWTTQQKFLIFPFLERSRGAAVPLS